MEGLNQFMEKLLQFRDNIATELPKQEKNVNRMFQGMRELIDNILYTDNAENNNRYPYYEKNIKVESLMFLINDFNQCYNGKNLNQDELLQKMTDIYVIVKNLYWHVEDIIKGLNSINKYLEKQIENKNDE